MTRDTSQILPLVQRHEKLAKPYQRADRQLGTLGTGNHFVEVCLDEAQRVWIMLHSGSRGVGNAIGTYFIDRAKQDMRRWFINLPDMDLAYIPEGSENFRDYVTGLKWAQNYALLNRELMMAHVIAAMKRELGREFDSAIEAVNCHHNYVTQESHFGKNVWLTRKGAVRARDGDLGIIPGSMGVRSFIVRGKGNPESFHSCSHGAGVHSLSHQKGRPQMASQIEVTAGTKIVRSFSNAPGCVWSSRLYVNGGEDATLVCAKHKTEAGARAWARKAVAQ